MSTEPELSRLYIALGDYLAGGRADGIFAARLGGPGSVTGPVDLGLADQGLAALEAPQWQLDLLPFPPSPGQRAALNALGYTLAAEREGELTFRHPAALDVVTLSHELGVSHAQKLLWEYLRYPANREVRAGYHRVYLAEGRRAADAAFIPQAQAAHVAQTGFGPLERAAALFTPLNLPWMFAAGWALDLHRSSVLGASPSRPHDDVDVALGREHQMPVSLALIQAGYRVHAVRDGMYVAWDTPLEAPNFQIHAHRAGSGMLDLMLTDLSNDVWHYRRDPAICLPLVQARQISPAGLPYLAPEAALLFKASPSNGVVRPKDQRDFGNVLPVLGASARTWLAARLGQDHPWQPDLRDESGSTPNLEE